MSSKLDQVQIMQDVHNPASQALNVKSTGGTLVTETFDYVSMTNSVISGQTVPTTIVYKVGGASGTVIATLTLTYDGSANLLTVTKS